MYQISCLHFGVDVRQFPARVLGDEVGVVADLGAVGIELVRGVGGHPAVCRHFFQRVALRLVWLNDLHLGHLAHLRSPEHYQKPGRKSIPNVARCTPSPGGKFRRCTYKFCRTRPH